MTWRPKLLALDVDGTLVSYGNEMAPAVRETVRAARDAGIHVVIATGRAVPGVYDVLDKLDMREGLAVASNGSVVFGVEPYELIKAVTFDAAPSVERLMEAFPDAMIAVEEIGVGYRVNRQFPSGEIGGNIQIAHVDQMIAGDACDRARPGPRRCGVPRDSQVDWARGHELLYRLHRLVRYGSARRVQGVGS